MIKSECETVIQYDLEERVATMFTRIPKDIRRLDNLCDKYPYVYKCTKRCEFGNTYKFDCWNTIKLFVLQRSIERCKRECYESRKKSNRWHKVKS